MDPGSGDGDSTRLDPEHFQALWLESRALRLLSEQARARARAAREQVRRGRSRREILHDSAFARLQARLESMPVIEQAKGIIMGQQGCGPGEAFDLLRWASQRSNVKLAVLAEQIIEQVTSGSNGGKVTPLPLGGTRYLPPGSRTRARPPAQ